MKHLFFAVAFVILQSPAYSQASATPGKWTFKTNNCKVNYVLPHRESTTVFDTTQNPHPKFIIDFYGKFPTEGGKYKVVRGAPSAPDQVSAGVGFLNGGTLTFYSTTGGIGQETVTVTVSNGLVTMTGADIEMANQKDQKDKAPITFSISRKQLP